MHEAELYRAQAKAIAGTTPSPVVDEYRLDRERPQFMLDNPRTYPLYVDTPLETLTAAVKARRLEAERERRNFKYPTVAPPPNYLLFGG